MSFPPQSFEQLRQLMIKFKQGEIDLTIGKKSLIALEYMVNNPEDVAISNIVELGKKLYFSPASITRLAKLLGFHGFNQYQLLFKQKSKITSHFYSEAVEKLMSADVKPSKLALTSQLKNVIANIEQGIDGLDDPALETATQLLANKNRIFIFGYRQSSAIANILRYGLALIRPNVQMLVQADHGVAIALGQVKKGDLLVVIGSAPYSNVTVKIANLAKKQQCQILSITDSVLSPLNELADVSLHIPTAGSFYANSLVANCFFVESLLSFTAISLGNIAIHNLQRHEELLSLLDVSS